MDKNENKIELPENPQIWQKLALIDKFRTFGYNLPQEQIDHVMHSDRKTILAEINIAGNDTVQDDNKQSLSRMVTDLCIGNKHDINETERNYISHLSLNNIVNFNVSAYQKVLNELINREMNDPQASKMFRKNYIDITAENTHTTSDEVLNLRTKYYLHKDWMIPAANAVTDLFEADFNNYLTKIDNYNKYVKIQINKQGPENTHYSQQDILNIHDAVYWLPRDMKQNDKSSFVDFINKQFIYADVNGNKHFRTPGEMEIIGKNWGSLSQEERTLGFKDILAKCRSKKYVNQKYAEFAEEAAHFGVSENNYKIYEKTYEAGLFTPAPFDTKVVFEKDGLRGRFLPRNDPRVGFFGNYTSCCQHFGGIGSKCAISSIKDPFSQLFAIENGKNEIIAGSWIWTNKVKKQNENGNDAMFKTATFDNIEAKLSYSEKNENIKDIYKMAAQHLAEQNFRMITIGKSNSDIGLGDLNDVSSVPMNPAYSGYSDASSQVLLLENPQAIPLPENATSLFVYGANQDDVADMQKVANQCFPNGDQQLQVPDSPMAMLLKDEGKTVGYILWTEDYNEPSSNGKKIDNWIYDLAVLPEYRKGAKAGSALLLNEMMRRVKEVGGEWGAELRDTTSLRYMRAMAGRNVVKMEELGVDHKMSDGTEVVEVTFSYIPEKGREIPSKKKTGFMDKMKKKFER